MMKIYIDKDCKCHVSDDGTMTPYETEFFDGKCDDFIEGHRIVLTGKTWTRSDGVTFRGEMITPWQDAAMLQTLQEQYEAMSVNEKTIAKAAGYDILMEGITV